MAKKKAAPKKSYKKKKTAPVKTKPSCAVSRKDYLHILIRLSERNIKENSDGTDFFAQQTARLRKELDEIS